MINLENELSEFIEDVPEEISGQKLIVKGKDKTKRPRTQNRSGAFWQERLNRRILIMEALRKLKCFTPMTGKPRNVLARMTGIPEKDIIHYCYKDNFLCNNGYVASVQVEGQKQLTYFLTPKGQKCIVDKTTMEGPDKKKE